MSPFGTACPAIQGESDLSMLSSGVASSAGALAIEAGGSADGLVHSNLVKWHQNIPELPGTFPMASPLPMDSILGPAPVRPPGWSLAEAVAQSQTAPPFPMAALPVANPMSAPSALIPMAI